MLPTCGNCRMRCGLLIVLLPLQATRVLLYIIDDKDHSLTFQNLHRPERFWSRARLEACCSGVNIIFPWFLHHMCGSIAKNSESPELTNRSRDHRDTVTSRARSVSSFRFPFQRIKNSTAAGCRDGIGELSQAHRVSKNSAPVGERVKGKMTSGMAI